jgi:hypothetical protein
MADDSPDRAVWTDPLRTRGYKQAGGNLLILPTLPGLNTVKPREFTFLLDWEAVEPMPVELEVQMQQQDPTVLAGGFPDATLGGGVICGAYFDAGGPDIWDSDGAGCVATRIETGAGNNARFFYCDLRPGRFSLGVQSRVRMSCARWIIADPTNTVFAVQATIAPAKFSDADPPTYSLQTVVPVGATRGFVTPAGAQWFDMVVGTRGAQVEAAVFGGLYYRDTTLAAPICYPPAPPWPVPITGGTWDITNVGAVDALVTMIFWVR